MPVYIVRWEEDWDRRNTATHLDMTSLAMNSESTLYCFEIELRWIFLFAIRGVTLDHWKSTNLVLHTNTSTQEHFTFTHKPDRGVTPFHRPPNRVWQKKKHWIGIWTIMWTQSAIGRIANPRYVAIEYSPGRRCGLIEIFYSKFKYQTVGLITKYQYEKVQLFGINFLESSFLLKYHNDVVVLQAFLLLHSQFSFRIYASIFIGADVAKCSRLLYSAMPAFLARRPHISTRLNHQHSTRIQ